MMRQTHSSESKEKGLPEVDRQALLHAYAYAASPIAANAG